MTSLIDVIFLLLLFFMLSSTFSKFAEVELLGAGAGHGEATALTPVFIRLEPQSLSLNGRAHDLSDLVPALGAMRDGTGQTTILVSLDNAVSAQRLVDLLAALRGVDAITVQVLGGK